jgi:hypothetical protein
MLSHNFVALLGVELLMSNSSLGVELLMSNNFLGVEFLMSKFVRSGAPNNTTKGHMSEGVSCNRKPTSS